MYPVMIPAPDPANEPSATAIRISNISALMPVLLSRCRCSPVNLPGVSILDRGIIFHASEKTLKRYFSMDPSYLNETVIL
jgi:hypothetical protein